MVRVKRGLGLLLWLLPLLFLGIFYFYPLASIFQVSFSRAEGGFGLLVQEMWQSASMRRVVGFTN